MVGAGQRWNYVEATPEIQVVWSARLPVGIGKELDAIVLPAVAVRVPSLRPGHRPDLAVRCDDFGVPVSKPRIHGFEGHHTHPGIDRPRRLLIHHPRLPPPDRPPGATVSFPAIQAPSTG